MKETPVKVALEKAVIEWKRKHKIRDDDPTAAILEILEIYFNHRYGNGPINPPPPSYTEFRDTLEQTDRITKELAKQAGKVTQELRAFPGLREELAHGKTAAILISSLAALIAGFVLGRFLS